MQTKAIHDKLERILMRMVGPTALNSDARKYLTEGRPVSATLHSVNPDKKYYIEVKKGRAFLTAEGETASVPFIPYDDIDANYFKSFMCNDKDIQLPNDGLVDAYFQRFEDVGFIF